MKVIVNIPHSSTKGGVFHHYKGLRPFWEVNVSYNVVGRRYNIPGFIFLPIDYGLFIFKCVFGNYDVIILNPSLGKRALVRDKWFLFIAKLFRKKVVVFFHGWLPEIVAKIDRNPSKFVKAFNSANRILVLAGAFKSDLIRWGITRPIYLTTTKVEDKLVKSFDINKKEYSKRLLFLARVETYKGIFITLKAYKEAKNLIPNLSLTIAGDGSQLEKAKSFVQENSLKDVEFLGYVTGQNLIKAFCNADVYILPSYSEGMPTTVLEAMAFGLPIITRPVGGINDFFENKKMGFLVQSINYQDYVKVINTLMSDNKKLKTISAYNHVFATNQFLSSKVTKQLESILSKI